MKHEPEKRRRAIWHAIWQFQRQYGRAPSIQQIVNATGMSSKSVVRYHLNALAERGIIRRASRIAKGIVLLEPFCWVEN